MSTTRFAFREKYTAIGKEHLNWYPGHMVKSFNKMQSKIKQVDCVMEVHDARIPISGRNPNFVRRLIGSKPHILVLNKRDLIGQRVAMTIKKNLSSQHENIIFTNSKDQHCRGLRQLVPRALDLIQGTDRFNRSEEVKMRLMVIGVPNVGKSSMMNALRNSILHKGKASAVGAIAGITRAIQNEVKVHYDPPVYLIDTPGILPPHVSSVDDGMKLALCSCLNDHVVGLVNIADYLLYWYNRNGLFAYVDFFKLPEPCDNITAVLAHIATQNSKYRQISNYENKGKALIPDINAGASVFIRAFRDGSLGQISLDVLE